MSEEKVLYYDFGEFRLDVINCRLLKNGTPVQLTNKSFEILLELIVKRERMLKKEELLKTIWEDCYVEEATLTQHIYMLRKTLQQNGKIYIETYPKNGYRFVAKVEEITVNGEGPVEEIFDEEIVSSVTEPEIDEKIEVAEASAPLEKSAANKKTNPLYKRIAQTAAAICILALLISLYFYLRGNNSPPETESAQIKSVAVLPFKQIADEKDEKLGLGLADVLITKLGNVEHLEVLPTSAIIRYTENESYNLAEVGKNLGVDAILSGTIQRDDDLIRVTVQFYSVKTQNFLWSEKFDETFSNIFVLQDSISERISKELAARINGSYKTVASAEYTKNPEAHQAYSMGLYHWNLRTKESLKKAENYFQSAINADPNFALAYAYLADTYSLMIYYELNTEPKESLLRKAKELAQKALELDSNCAEAMIALATISTGENRDEESFALLKKAIELKPNNVAAHQRISWMYAGSGNLEKAVQEMRTAQNLDPQARATNIGLAQLLNYARNPKESEIFSRRVLELMPNDETAKLQLAESLEQEGSYEEAQRLAQEILKKEENKAAAKAILGRINAKSGNKEKALEILKEIEKGKDADSNNYEIASIYTALGEHEMAIESLKKSIKRDEFIKFFAANDYNFDALKENPEFAKILK